MMFDKKDCVGDDIANTHPKDIGHANYKTQAMFADLQSRCKKFLIAHIPLLTWLPHYSLHNLQCDFIAGVTVGLMVVPQALAYASIARLSNEYGLYSSFIGCLVYCFLGTSKDVTLGPTAILCIMMVTYNVPECAETAVTFSLYVGVILFAMGIFNLGFLVRFVSVPVISAFTSAAAITIALGQLKDINGLKHVPRDFLGNLKYVFQNVEHWNFHDLAFGTGCIIILLLLRLCSRVRQPDSSATICQRILRKLAWLFGISRNALVVLLSCFLIYGFNKANISHEFSLIEDINPGIPSFEPPSFPRKCKNETFGFVETIDQFRMGILIVPLLAFMEAMAIGKAFGRLNNYKIIPSQELIALGVSNILGSFVSAFPVTGSFSRTAVCSQSGVKTPLAGVFTATVVLLATEYLTRYFNYIPVACLGAVIISAVLPMVDFRIVKSIWTVHRIDMLTFVVTFFGCFYTLEFGLILGVVISLCFVLYPVVNPKLLIEAKDVAIIRVQNGLQYPGVEKIINSVETLLSVPSPPIAVIIDMNGVLQIDFTVAAELHELLNQTRTNLPGTEILVSNVCFGVKKVLIMAGLHDIITSPENVSERYEEGRRLLYD